MARITSGRLVTGLVAAALAAVSVLAVLAARAAGSVTGASGPGARTVRATGGGTTAPPGGSGVGERVVYSVSRGRVWLVGGDEGVVRTFPVQAGDVAPAVGLHRVFARRLGGVGGDGAKVEHVVFFAATDGMNVGFSAAKDGSTAPPDPAKRTTAIREARADGVAMWEWATIGAVVNVIR